MTETQAIGIDQARALAGDAALWPRVRDFLWNFAAQIHPSWLADVPGASGLSGISDSPRVRKYVLSALGVEPCFHAFPKEDGSRLLLLDGSTLESVVMWLGALSCAGRLRTVTGGSSVRALKAALPGVYPDVFSYTAYFGRMEAQHPTDDPAGVVAAGRDILAGALSSLPGPLAARLALKLPKSLAADGEPRASAGVGTVMKLLKLKFPEAYKLCCS